MTDSTPLTVLLNRHLTDLQLSNSPDQYLIGWVLARLMVLERSLWAAFETPKPEAAEAEYWKMTATLLAEWVKEGKVFRGSMTVEEIRDRAGVYVIETVADNVE